MKKKAFGVVYALLTLFILGGCSTEDILGIKRYKNKDARGIRCR
ncbi:hypothetical protein [Priestia megaterium]|nr:hypothetical protein [Priestia megaterium]MED3863451.1 hypothetical protein [Priestia megaterium]MED4101493.1 hypothetical protein [Priestia megaterium]MED4144954.1 hypothetical protein [Priestia megaterium]MED4170070.1 hypothetical protein [Priestia megaterium]MED4199426.1 hypothetical protein [Priestia megaterium]